MLQQMQSYRFECLKPVAFHSQCVHDAALLMKSLQSQFARGCMMPSCDLWQECWMISYPFVAGGMLESSRNPEGLTYLGTFQQTVDLLLPGPASCLQLLDICSKSAEPLHELIIPGNGVDLGSSFALHLQAACATELQVLCCC